MFELFLRPGEPSSERVRAFVADHYLEDAVMLRDVSGAGNAEALEALGGERTPALWDGERLHAGAEACMARLQVLTNIGRAP